MAPWAPPRSTPTSSADSGDWRGVSQPKACGKRLPPTGPRALAAVMSSSETQAARTRTRSRPVPRRTNATLAPAAVSLGDEVGGGAAVAGAVAEPHVDLLGFIQPRRDPAGNRLRMAARPAAPPGRRPRPPAPAAPPGRPARVVGTSKPRPGAIPAPAPAPAAGGRGADRRTAGDSATSLAVDPAATFVPGRLRKIPPGMSTYG
jgi:hypothetical protein